MNIAQLRYAQAVAREGSFGRAARACSVTQPALSNGIAMLERSLGDRLFDRSTRGATPTQFGERILPLIDTALRGVDTVLVEARLATAEQPRPLRVGVSPLINSGLVGAAFEAVSAIAPQRRVVLQAANVSDLRDALDSAGLDLIIVPAGPDFAGHEQVVIGQEPMVFLSPHVTEAQGSRAPIDLSAVSMPLVLATDACGLTPFTRAVFASAGRVITEYPGQAHDCRVVQDWVALGLGSALLPASKVTDQVAARPVLLGDTPVTITYQASWLRTAPLAAEIAAIAMALANATTPPSAPPTLERQAHAWKVAVAAGKQTAASLG